jgi:hypothetical protein
MNKKTEARNESRILFRRDAGYRKNIPNYFWYVAPIKAIPLCIPDYSGLIQLYLEGSYIIPEVIKRAPKLHSSKLCSADKIKMLRTLMFKYWKVCNELSVNKVQRELFN